MDENAHLTYWQCHGLICMYKLFHCDLVELGYEDGRVILDRSRAASPKTEPTEDQS